MKYKLGEIIELNPRESIKKGNIARKIAMDDLGEFKRDIESYSYSEYKGGTKFRNYDTLMARITPCLENGKTSFVNILEENEVAFGSTEYFVFRAKQDIINPYYLYYLVTTDKFREVAIKSMSGTSGRQRVQKDQILDFSVDLPSLEDQEKIMKPLKLIDDKISLNTKLNTNLKLLKTAIFNNMFNSKLLNNLNGKLADIAKIQTGKRPISRSSTYNNENKYPIVGASKIMGYTNSYNIDDSIITTGRVGTHGIIQRFREPVWISDNSFIFTSHYEDYLYEILKNRINYTSLNRGSTQPLITQTDLKNIDIYVPTDEEHRQFKTLIYPITNIEFTLNNEQHKLFKIKNLLLNKFFNSSKLTN